MVKESNIAITTIMFGIICIIFNLLGIQIWVNILVETVATLIDIVTLFSSIKHKKSVVKKRDEYVVAIILSIMALVFNAFLVLSNIILFL